MGGARYRYLDFIERCTIKIWFYYFFRQKEGVITSYFRSFPVSLAASQRQRQLRCMSTPVGCLVLLKHMFSFFFQRVKI